MSLKEHTVKSYDKDINAISETINEMRDLVLVAIDMVASAIQESSDEAVANIKAHDYKINSLDFLIEKKITAMLALRQPMAVDLRYIVSALKVSSNLERIGDQTKSIIKKINRIGNEAFEGGVKESLLEMIKVSKEMIIDSVFAFNEQDIEKSQLVLQRDDEIDNLYTGLFRITQNGNVSQEKLERIINILFIAKSFERLADNSTNIAEIASYVVTGETK